MDGKCIFIKQKVSFKKTLKIDFEEHKNILTFKH